MKFLFFCNFEMCPYHTVGIQKTCGDKSHWDFTSYSDENGNSFSLFTAPESSGCCFSLETWQMIPVI